MRLAAIFLALSTVIVASPAVPNTPNLIRENEIRTFSCSTFIEGINLADRRYENKHSSQVLMWTNGRHAREVREGKRSNYQESRHSKRALPIAGESLSMFLAEPVRVLTVGSGIGHVIQR
jgi:hypothetical protein